MSEKKKFKDTFKFMMDYVFSYRKSFIIVISIMIFSSLISAPIPILTGNAIDNLVNTNSIRKFLVIILIIFLLEIFKLSLLLYSKKRLSKINYAINTDIKSAILKKIMHYKMNFFLENNPGYISSRVNEVDSASIITSYSTIYSLITIFDMVISTVVAMSINIYIIFVILPFVFAIIIITYKSNNKLGILSKKQYEASAEFNSKVYERFSGIEYIKMNNLYDKELDILKTYLNKLFNKKYEYSKCSINLSEVILFLSRICSVFILLISGIFIFWGSMTLGDYVAITQCVAKITGSVTVISILPITLKPAFVSLERIIQFISLEEERDGYQLKKNEVIDEIELKDIRFSYNNLPIINDLNIEFNKDNVYKICGNNGSGKTTLLKIISHLYEVDGGVIKINNKVSDMYNVDSIREHISFMSQNYFFDENIVIKNLVCNEDEKNKLENLILKYNLTKELNFLGEGFDTEILYDGSNFSEGQCQLLSVIRTVLSEKDILIFDEPLSNLDHSTANKVAKMISEINNAIVIIISHLDIIDNCYTIDLNSINNIKGIK